MCGCGWVGGPGSNRSSPAVQQAGNRALADLAGGNQPVMGTPSPPGSACPAAKTQSFRTSRKLEAYANHARTCASPLAGRDTATPAPCLRGRTTANTYRPSKCVTVARPADRHSSRPLAGPRSDTLPCRRCQSLRLLLLWRTAAAAESERDAMAGDGGVPARHSAGRLARQTEPNNNYLSRTKQVAELTTELK